MTTAIECYKGSRRLDSDSKSSDDGPFRLLDLPQEIQDQISEIIHSSYSVTARFQRIPVPEIRQESRTIILSSRTAKLEPRAFMSSLLRVICHASEISIHRSAARCLG